MTSLIFFTISHSLLKPWLFDIIYSANPLVKKMIIARLYFISFPRLNETFRSDRNVRPTEIKQ
jgi:hypothetical protein